jgi:hypothetical protein
MKTCSYVRKPDNSNERLEPQRHRGHREFSDGHLRYDESVGSNGTQIFNFKRGDWPQMGTNEHGYDSKKEDWNTDQH